MGSRRVFEKTAVDNSRGHWLEDLYQCSVMSRHRRYDEDAGYSSSRHEKPCRACVDINTFMSSQGKAGFLTPKEGSDHQCPLDKNELGRKSWALLHTIAAYYQERP